MPDMLKYSIIALATLSELNNELAAAGWESTHSELHLAQEAVATLLHELTELRLYDSTTSQLVTAQATVDQARESCHTVKGHILVDGRLCFVAE